MKNIYFLVAVLTLIASTVNAQYYGTGNAKVGTNNSSNKSNTGKSRYQSSQKNYQKSSQANRQTGSSQTATDETSSLWDGGVYGIGYNANFDYADKGAFGLNLHGFYGEGHPVGMSLMYNGIYNLASEKFFDGYQAMIGPNFNYPVNENVILFAPLCVSVSTISGSDKIYWGASFMPSLGLKFGNLFLSAGWNLFYNFSAKEDQFNSKTFMVTLGIFN